MVLVSYSTQLQEESGARSVHLQGPFLVGTSPGEWLGGWVFSIFLGPRPAHDLVTSRRSHLQMPAHWGVEGPTHEFWRDTNTRSTADAIGQSKAEKVGGEIWSGRGEGGHGSILLKCEIQWPFPSVL